MDLGRLHWMESIARPSHANLLISNELSVLPWLSLTHMLHVPRSAALSLCPAPKVVAARLCLLQNPVKRGENYHHLIRHYTRNPSLQIFCESWDETLA